MNIKKYQQLQLNGKIFSYSELSASTLDEFQHIDSDNNQLFHFIKDWISDSPFVTINTSGSTGDPKQFKVSKESMIKSALSTVRFFDLNQNDRVLLCLPVDYIAGKMMVVRAFVTRFNLIPIKPSISPLSTIRESFKFAAMTPMQVRESFDLKDGIEKLNLISTLIIGGGEISNSLAEKIQFLSNSCWQTYGMTETLTHVAVRRLNGENKSEKYVGLPGFKFSRGKDNCLLIKSPYPEWPEVHTNDAVNLHSTNSFTFLGRLDFVINSGGIKLFPEVIENKLQIFFGKQRIIISSVWDERLGEKPVLVIEGKQKIEISLTELQQKAPLSKIETPKQILSLNTFPETNSGKINRSQIKALLHKHLK